MSAHEIRPSKPRACVPPRLSLEPMNVLQRPPRLVAIGGGTGLPVVLEGLADRLRRYATGTAGLPTIHDCLSAIVTVTDDGGSSGWIRKELGTLPPGDIRNCMAALARNGSPLVPLLQYRFSRATNQLNGQSLGNLVLAALAEMTGDFAEAVDQLSRLVGTTGRVFPSTGENVSLRAEFVTGEVLAGETAIVQRRCPIWRLSLERPVQPLPDAIRALVNADGVVVGPGSLYTSLLPNLLVGGIAPTISGIDAVRIYVANLMTQPGETEGFDVGAHLRVIREHAGGDLFDYVVVNRGGIDEAVAREYAQRGAYPVAFSGSPGGAMEIVECDLIDRDALPEVRHSSAALASVILDLVRRGRPRTQ